MALAKYKDWISENGHVVLTSWAMNGLTDEQIASNMGINVRTFYTWKDKYKEIASALETGRVLADMQVFNALYKSALGYEFTEKTVETLSDGSVTRKEVTKHYPPNVQAIIFYLTNRRPDKWKKNPTEDSANSEAIAKIKQLLDGIPSAF